MIVLFFRGLPGAGKTELACKVLDMQNLPDDDRSFIICEADDFFYTGAGYQFDAKKIHHAHQECFEKYKSGIKEKLSCIIVSNTSTQEWEIEPYQKLAEENGYQFFSLILENRHGNKNVHDVPESSINKMETRLRNSIKLR